MLEWYRPFPLCMWSVSSRLVSRPVVMGGSVATTLLDTLFSPVQDPKHASRRPREVILTPLCPVSMVLPFGAGVRVPRALSHLFPFAHSYRPLSFDTTETLSQNNQTLQRNLLHLSSNTPHSRPLAGLLSLLWRVGVNTAPKAISVMLGFPGHTPAAVSQAFLDLLTFFLFETTW